MQIDFHHAATYTLARLAGFDHPAASVVAHAAQYVDDALGGGLIRFDNGALYHRTYSAHKALDYRDAESLASHRVWVPFHFLPGNCGLPAGVPSDLPFLERVFCRPDSHVARDMVRAAVRDRGRPGALHRLGITLHVYADTWAHAGFSGLLHHHNRATDLAVRGVPDTDLMAWISGFFLNAAGPIGHGAVMSNPDKPYLVWSYRNATGAIVERDNPRDYLAASQQLCVAMQRFVRGDPDAVVDGLMRRDQDTLEVLFREITDPDGDVRHAHWVEQVANGAFSFGRASIAYRAKGEGSWKHAALGTVDTTNNEDEVFPFDLSFLDSDWKHFHDGLLNHRTEVVTNILPRYGLCVA